MTEERKTLNLSKYKTAAGAAKATREFLLQLLQDDREIFGDPPLTPEESGIILRAPGDQDETWAQGAWHLIWEGGPFEWANAFLEGSGLYIGEGYGDCGPLLICPDRARWEANVGFSFSILFRED